MLYRGCRTYTRFQSTEAARVLKDQHFSHILDGKAPNFLQEQGSDTRVIVGKEKQPLDFNYFLFHLEKFKKMSDLPTGFGRNQLHESLKDKEKTNELLIDIKSRFEDIDYSFGYGSKIFSQGSKVDVSNSQIDMIYAVTDTKAWHEKNLAKNGNDYSFLKYLGINSIKKIGELGAGVYFNPYINVALKNGKEIELKYGVTSIDALRRDLQNWETLYMAGRLHKPVAIIDNNPQLSILNQFNLTNAVKLALLLHDGRTISEKELFLIIASLSYMGDPRMKVNGENPDKIKNIVDNQFDLFQKLYKPIFKFIPHLIELESSGVTGKVFKVKLNEENVGRTLLELPSSFRARFFENYPSIEDPVVNNIDNDLTSLKKLAYNELKEIG
ncbi:hypothetical protein CANINC_004573 [Pichia inconspicua]|uniref:Phosphatidate cytidylyltransferase, mitochondrial n=1 Tax=Pichia inconspicua TaxID=52247 RepID=A0A4T0WVM6_9ASCO|nr:hypothetical protein CANINC_004573 [[Candida] inconspicua]